VEVLVNGGTGILRGLIPVTPAGGPNMPFRLPLNSQAPWIGRNAVPGDDSATREDLGVTFRPAEEAIADTVRWPRETGRLSPRQAGRAAA
jgi:hypothetical protein